MDYGKSRILCSRLQMLTIALSKSLHKLFKLKKFVTVPISLIAAFLPLPSASPRPDKGWKMILFADGLVVPCILYKLVMGPKEGGDIVHF